ncbi:glycosyltransferase family 4 protein [Qipengyuania sediminis]|uniref:glycosyltransferase family 4 protein n=1 Tax=Qipengyuania sediminis TaxID=1532023 RepID=UPI001059BFFD|nr:glycosyltransferase family 4 protein [Qipengyuania sediminis]
MPEPERAGGRPEPLRLLLFIDGLGSGGAQRQFVHLAIGLKQRGHRVTVAVYNDQDHFAPEIEGAGIEIVKVTRPGRFSFTPVITLARLYRAGSFDGVIAFLRTPAIIAELARALHPRMVVIAAERTTYPVLPLPFALAMTQRLHRLARFVTVNSAHHGKVMKRVFPELADRVVVIRNGVAVPPKAQREAGLPHPGGALRLVAISSLMPYKNSLRLAEALALLRNEYGLNVSVSWLGERFEGHTGHGVYEQMSTLIDSLGVADRWHWLGVTQDVAAVLDAHDALIHPSLYEGTSNAVCEAMAAGRPVIAGRVADHAEMLEQTGAGMLFDPLDVRSIAEAIARFASLDPAARTAMGDRGRAVIEARYAFDTMVTSYERLARAALSPGRTAFPALSNGHGEASRCAE